MKIKTVCHACMCIFEGIVSTDTAVIKAKSILLQDTKNVSISAYSDLIAALFAIRKCHCFTFNFVHVKAQIIKICVPTFKFTLT